MTITKKDTIILAVLLNLVVLVGVFVTARPVLRSHDQKNGQNQTAVEDPSSEGEETKEETVAFDEIDQLLEEYDAKQKGPRLEKEAQANKKVEKTTPKITPVSKDGYYVVRPGDNPWKIAKKFHLSFEKLLALNNLDEQKAKNLKVGQTLRIKEG